MILHGNQRGGAKNLALHLLKPENEHVEIHELRGFVADNLMGAFNEAYALSRGTKAKQFLYSLSLNPPPSENVPTQAFENAINRIEHKLGLDDQPRAIVFHEKHGRRHAHAVWSRIDTNEMKAINLSFTKRKLMEVARELFREHGWQMPRGLMRSEDRDPRNFTLAQWQQAKRQGKDPKTIKQALQDCWAVSDSQTALQQALAERGYILARGDRRSFVAVDYHGEIYAVAKWVGIKSKDVKARLTDGDALPSVDEAKAQITEEMRAHLQRLRDEQDSAIRARLNELEDARAHMADKHAAAREALRLAQAAREVAETKARQERFNKGLRGFWDRLSGAHKRIKEQNEQEASAARTRDQKDTDALVFEQLEQRRSLQARIDRLGRFHERSDQTLQHDLSRYEEMSRAKPDRPARHVRRGPDRER